MSMGFRRFIFIMMFLGGILFFLKSFNNVDELIISHLFVLNASRAKVFYFIMGCIAFFVSIPCLWMSFKHRELIENIAKTYNLDNSRRLKYYFTLFSIFSSVFIILKLVKMPHLPISTVVLPLFFSAVFAYFAFSRKKTVAFKETLKSNEVNGDTIHKMLDKTIKKSKSTEPSIGTKTTPETRTISIYDYEPIDSENIEKIKKYNFKKPLEDGLPAATHWFINHEKKQALYYIGGVSNSILRCNGESMYEFAFFTNEKCVHIEAYIFPNYMKNKYVWCESNRLLFRTPIESNPKDLENDIKDAIICYLNK